MADKIPAVQFNCAIHGNCRKAHCPGCMQTADGEVYKPWCNHTTEHAAHSGCYGYCDCEPQERPPHSAHDVNRSPLPPRDWDRQEQPAFPLPGVVRIRVAYIDAEGSELAHVEFGPDDIDQGISLMVSTVPKFRLVQ